MVHQIALLLLVPSPGASGVPRTAAAYPASAARPLRRRGRAGNYMRLSAPHEGNRSDERVIEELERVRPKFREIRRG